MAADRRWQHSGAVRSLRSILRVNRSLAIAESYPKASGQYRWQLLQYNPLRDESGSIIRWYATATDIDDQKRSEERLRDENIRLDQERVYLEEQIRNEMGFEQIIGNSSALKSVLQLIETVAPSDSTVQLLGETGTGKELIARAVHERSRRKAKTSVKLNCAAIPTGLLESELFGHEKGAFTGAIVQKAAEWSWLIRELCFWMK